MKSQKLKILCFLLFIILLVITCSENDDATGPQQAKDLVWVDSVSATTNSQVSIDIHMRNSSSIIGVEVPLRLSGIGFTIDSGCFNGGICENVATKKCSIDVPCNTVYFTVIEMSGIGKGEGIFASLWISLNSQAGGQVITIDSAMVPVSQNVYHLVSYAKSDLTQVLPGFIPGKIVVQP